MLKVFHLNNSTFGMRMMHTIMPGEDGTGPSFPKDYELVADVNTSDLDKAYELTNSIEHSWTINPEVHAYKARCRSTSMEDVILTEDGIAMQVAFFGFTPLPGKWEVGEDNIPKNILS